MCVRVSVVPVSGRRTISNFYRDVQLGDRYVGWRVGMKHRYVSRSVRLGCAGWHETSLQSVRLCRLACETSLRKVGRYDCG